MSSSITRIAYLFIKYLRFFQDSMKEYTIKVRCHDNTQELKKSERKKEKEHQLFLSSSFPLWHSLIDA
jgi:hypothetical protein